MPLKNKDEIRQRNKCIAIQSTDATIAGFKSNGLWERQYKTLESFSTCFDVRYYTSDNRNYYDCMPKNVLHVNGGGVGNIFGLRHICFYIQLIGSAFFWRFSKNTVIRVFGVTIPVLPVLKLVSGKKIIVSFQYDWASQTALNYSGFKRLVSHAVQYISLSASDHVICTMSWLKELAAEKYKKKKVSVIPNYVDMEMFQPQNKLKTIVFAGRLHYSKGVDLLIDAFIGLKEVVNGYRVIIIGDGDEAVLLKKKAHKHPMIVFLGNIPISDVAKQMNTASYFVLPTRTMEGHPKALIEAMASGCVCVASNAPGNREVMTECGCEQLLFKKDSVHSLMDTLMLAFKWKNPGVFRKFAHDNYDFEKLMPRELAVLSSNIR